MFKKVNWDQHLSTKTSDFCLFSGDVFECLHCMYIEKIQLKCGAKQQAGLGSTLILHQSNFLLSVESNPGLFRYVIGPGSLLSGPENSLHLLNQSDLN